MQTYQHWVAFNTILMKEIKRVIRIWAQTLLPAVITTMLYFLIFGKIIGTRIGDMSSVPYIRFITPGLIIMAVITSSYSATVASFFSAKFQRSIEEWLISPTPIALILLGYMAGGVARGLIVGTLVAIVALFFEPLAIHSYLVVFSVALLTACIFSLGGIINAIYAVKFDDIAIVPTFVLTPLTYLGGVFYSITLLPGFWAKLSHFNPIVYIVNTFRFGFLNIKEQHIAGAYGVMLLTFALLFMLALRLLRTGKNLRQ